MNAVDGTVKLWDMKHFTQSKGSTGSNEYHPTTEDLLLATIETHNGGGSVNVCRWSPCGQLLALGDDRYILVFRQNKGAIPTNSFGSLQPKNKVGIRQCSNIIEHLTVLTCNVCRRIGCGTVRCRDIPWIF